MKKFLFFTLICSMCIVALSCQKNNMFDKNKEIGSTNLNGLQIKMINQEKEKVEIVYPNQNSQLSQPNEVLIFMNGSLSRNFATKDKEQIWIPVQKIYEECFRSKISSEILDKIPSKIINNTVYILYQDFNKLHSQANSFYYNGNDESGSFLLHRIPAVYLSDYEKSAPNLTKDQALEELNHKLVLAYEKKYGKFASLNQKPDHWDTLEDKERFRYVFSHLTISRETDRFYIVPVVNEFAIDKYTGEIFNYYNGEIQRIDLFDPNSKDAIAFPG